MFKIRFKLFCLHTETKRFCFDSDTKRLIKLHHVVMTSTLFKQSSVKSISLKYQTIRM